MQDIHSIPKTGSRDVLTLFLVACDWRLGQLYCVPQDSQMQFDVGFGSSSTILLLGTLSILIVYKISGKILTPPVSPISSQSLIYLSLLPYHLKVVDHSKEIYTSVKSPSGLQYALSTILSTLRISAHVKLKRALLLASILAMDLYTELPSPVKSPAVASAAWLFVSYHQ